MINSKSAGNEVLCGNFPEKVILTVSLGLKLKSSRSNKTRCLIGE